MLVHCGYAINRFYFSKGDNNDTHIIRTGDCKIPDASPLPRNKLDTRTLAYAWQRVGENLYNTRRKQVAATCITRVFISR